MGSIKECTWQLVLTGELEEHAWAAVTAIADRLYTLPADWVADSLPELYKPDAANNPSLAGGRAGLALFYAYLAEFSSRDEDRARAGEILEEAIDLMAARKMRPSLYAGFAGVAWVTQHLQELANPGGDDPNEAIDDVLLDYLGRSPWPDEYDLVHGLVGLGVYALERLPRPSAVECLSRIVDRLDDTAARTTDGITWVTWPELLPQLQRAQCPQGYYNLGVAHGVPGVIAVLGRVCAADVAVERARPLLDGAVRWLLAQRLPDGSASAFPYWVGPGIAPQPARSAWCYGDPGVAVTLLSAARSVNEPAWEREAMEIARHVLRRPPENAGVVDAGLCHGAAGLGHVLNRIYQVTGDTEFADGASFWLRRALELRRADDGIAGFMSLMGSADLKRVWVADPYFLTGAAGVGLALLAAITPTEPAWDRVLLASVPAPTP